MEIILKLHDFLATVILVQFGLNFGIKLKWPKKPYKGIMASYTTEVDIYDVYIYIRLYTDKLI